MRFLLLLAAVALAMGAAHAGGGGGGYGASCARLEHLWDRAGGPPADAEEMASIGEAESSGDRWALSPAGAEGYWQIMPGHPGHPPTYSALGNAEDAVYVFETQGLTAWDSYSNGSAAGRC